MRKALRNRPLDSSLILINQKDYRIYGDVVITGQLIVINSKLTIKGNLTILKNENLDDQIFILESIVYATSVDSEVDITTTNGLFKVKSYLNCPNLYGGTLLSSNGNINIYYNSCVNIVIAKNYNVGGNNHSGEVVCSDSIFIGGDSISKAMYAQRLHIEGDADFGGSNISIGCFTSNGHVRNCYRNLKS